MFACSLLLLRANTLPQAVLGGISLLSKEYKTAESQPHLEALGVFKHAIRIARGEVPAFLMRAIYLITVCQFSHCRCSHYQKERGAAQIWSRTVSVKLIKLFARLRNLSSSFRARSLTAKAWDDRPIVMRQLPQIGEKSYVAAIKFDMQADEHPKQHQSTSLDHCGCRSYDLPLGSRNVRSLQYGATSRAETSSSGGGKLFS